MDWQNLSKEECVKKLETNQNKGLSTSQVKKRLEQYGTNELTHKKKNGFFKKFISQFSDFMVIILLIAAAVSFITSLIRHDMDFIDSIINSKTCSFFFNDILKLLCCGIYLCFNNKLSSG